MLRALIWDVDGTIAETERDGHRIAFNLALASLGLPWQWDVDHYGRLLQVAGGYERLLHDLQHRPDAPANPAERARLARAIHERKGRFYAERVAEGRMPARPGVLRLIEECEAAGVKQAVATTTGRANVDALFPRLFGAHWQDRFAAVVCAEDAPQKKPDPSAYRVVLDRLALSASTALAIEDSPNGLAAATAAGIATLITRSAYFAREAFIGAALVCDDLDRPVRYGGQRWDRVGLVVCEAVLRHRE